MCARGVKRGAKKSDAEAAGDKCEYAARADMIDCLSLTFVVFMHVHTHTHTHTHMYARAHTLLVDAR